MGEIGLSGGDQLVSGGLDRTNAGKMNQSPLKVDYTSGARASGLENLEVPHVSQSSDSD